MSKTTVGLLPLYLKLYDDTRPEIRADFDGFMKTVTDGLTSRDVDVVSAEVCRVQDEFREAVRRFEEADVDLIVTLHLAYSPSLESVDILAATERPILMLDTTMDAGFGPDVDASRIMYNHGIHGVQDLASMLRRRGKPYEIVAGHVTDSNVLQRAAHMAHAAYAARLFRTTRVLRIGESFRGMGDFAVEAQTLRDVLGIHVDQIGKDDLIPSIEKVSDDELSNEVATDRDRFVPQIDEAVHERSVRIGLGLRRYLEQGRYGAFSMNFLAFGSAEGPVNTVPFLEASKAMARGLGYAGEGDVLTASLVGALNRAFGNTTFTEIFCPDWAGGSLFLSHMGEINPEVAADKPLLCEKDFPWAAAQNPAVITCAPAEGPAVLVNLAPGPNDTFGLIIATVTVLGDATNETLKDSVRGWIRPKGPLEDFLETYSRHGGTHHSALVMGEKTEALKAFGSFVGIPTVVV